MSCTPPREFTEKGLHNLGLSLVRDAVAIRESQARGLVVADRVALTCELTFVSLAERAEEPPIAAAWEALRHVWDEPLASSSP